MICLGSTNRCLGLNMDMLESDDLFVFYESMFRFKHGHAGVG